MPLVSGMYYLNHPGGSSEKPPIVLIHGAGGTGLFWPSEIRRLAGYRVIAPDLPGHGKSVGAGCQSIGQYSLALIDLLDKMDLYQAVFVGHSMGGAIALQLALDYPDRVVGLSLFATGATFEIPHYLVEDAANDLTYISVINWLAAHSFNASADERLVQLGMDRLAEIRGSVLYGDLLACETFDVIASVSNIRCPVQIICGSEDRLTPPRFSHFLASRIPHSWLNLVNQAGHMLIWEQPLVTANLLWSYLDNLPYQLGRGRIHAESYRSVNKDHESTSGAPQ